MNFIGGIEGMDFKPITGYNNYLKNAAAFDVNDGVEFENVLNTRKAFLEQNAGKINGGIEMNVNFDDLISKSSQKDSSTVNSTGELLKSLSGSFNGGLNSVNNANLAAERAQEALAMGEDISVHDVMIAAEKSSLGMQMAMQLRNKMITAYNEINNVRV